MLSQLWNQTWPRPYPTSLCCSWQYADVFFPGGSGCSGVASKVCVPGKSIGFKISRRNALPIRYGVWASTLSPRPERLKQDKAKASFLTFGLRRSQVYTSTVEWLGHLTFPSFRKDQVAISTGEWLGYLTFPQLQKRSGSHFYRWLTGGPYIPPASEKVR